MSPCIECGESAREKHGGACVGLAYDEDDTARYYCLDCAICLLEARCPECGGELRADGSCSSCQRWPGEPP